jgi:hypothetical protein
MLGNVESAAVDMRTYVTEKAAFLGLIASCQLPTWNGYPAVSQDSTPCTARQLRSLLQAGQDDSGEDSSASPIILIPTALTLLIAASQAAQPGIVQTASI